MKPILFSENQQKIIMLWLLFSAISFSTCQSSPLSLFGVGGFAVGRVSTNVHNVRDFTEDIVKHSEEIIKEQVLNEALINARQLLQLNGLNMQQQGWRVVHESKLFSLYKRKKQIAPVRNHSDKVDNDTLSLPIVTVKSKAKSDKKEVISTDNAANNAPTEYLMMGEFHDISPRTFMFSQISNSCRKLWDKTMKEMTDGKIAMHQFCPSLLFSDHNSASISAFSVPHSDLSNNELVVTSQLNHETNDDSIHPQPNLFKQTQDIVYSRTKLPWPMKDRDYNIARRVKVYKDDGAVVLVTQSTEVDAPPAQDGAVRVDNFWCSSVVFSTQPLKTSQLSSKLHDDIATDNVPSITHNQYYDIPSLTMSGDECRGGHVERSKIGSKFNRRRFLSKMFRSITVNADINDNNNNTTSITSDAKADTERTSNVKQVSSNKSSLLYIARRLWHRRPRIRAYSRANKIGLLKSVEGIKSRQVLKKMSSSSAPSVRKADTTAKTQDSSGNDNDNVADYKEDRSSGDMTHAEQDSHNTVITADDVPVDSLVDDGVETAVEVDEAAESRKALTRRRLYGHYRDNESTYEATLSHQEEFEKAQKEAQTEAEDLENNSIDGTEKQTDQTESSESQSQSAIIGSQPNADNTQEYSQGYNQDGAQRGGDSVDQGNTFTDAIQSLSSHVSSTLETLTARLNYGNLFKPGMKFVTIFCDDQKTPLPASVLDMLTKQGEKMVPGAINQLHSVLKNIELSKSLNGNR